MMILCHWYSGFIMKLTEEKYYLVISGHKYEHIWTNINNVIIWEYYVNFW